MIRVVSVEAMPDEYRFNMASANSGNNRRLGMTVPLPGPLHSHKEWLHELADIGYSDIWSAESDGADGFTPLALAAAWEPRLRLGTAIIPAYTRAPACMAQSVASMADAAPGRFCIGIGSSSNVIVERWNGVPFEQPYQKMRDMVRFLKEALEGDKVSREFDTFAVNGFRLGVRPEQTPPIFVAALREQMLRLAGRESDGAIINWLGADDVPQVASIVHDAAGGEEREIVARIFVCPSDNTQVVRDAAKFAIAAYMNVPVYAKFQEWLGRGPQLEGMWSAWSGGDRKAALAAISDEVVDSLIVHGTPEQCKEQIGRYLDNGVTTAALALLPLDKDLDQRDAMRSLAGV
jgi:probable F420-dependent oxidoreductase